MLIRLFQWMRKIICFIATTAFYNSVMNNNLKNVYTFVQTRKHQEAKTRLCLFLQVVGHDISGKGQFV